MEGMKNLPSLPFLPDPLVMDEGNQNIPVTNLYDWNQQKERIRDDYQHYISGTVPPSPASFQVHLLSERKEGEVLLRKVELRFGPEYQAKMTVEVMIPAADEKLPVFMTQWNHRGWAQVAVRRGYIGCVYAGADAKDDTKNYDDIFSGYDFATLMKRAWGASRVVDYLYQLPEVDTAAIALTGHSRNGKQSLMAAAFDERIKAVVSSSGGTGGESTFRWSDDRFNSESLEEITRNFPHWFSPRLRGFAGREQNLPVDQNSLMSLIAPRGLMLVSAITESQGNPWGIGQSYESVKRVYNFLGEESNISLLLRRGRHQHSTRDIEDFLDFFDFIFKRTDFEPQNKLYYDYSFEKWQKFSGEDVDLHTFPSHHNSLEESLEESSLEAFQDSIRSKISWLFGEEPAGFGADGEISPLLRKNSTYPNDYLDEVIGQPSLKNTVKKMAIGPYYGLGDNLWTNLYVPAESVRSDSVIGQLPLIIYLHGYSYATGYHRRSAPIIEQFVEEGFAVLCFDMIGFGSRIEENLNFYRRYPNWSLMGKMVTDVRNILDDIEKRVPFIDSANINIAGYSLGGTVAIFTAAMDERINSTAVISGFGPWRKIDDFTEGIRHFFDLHGLIPRLGFFEGNENRIPVDFNEILFCILPRKLLVVAPEGDRHHPVDEVEKLFLEVRGVARVNNENHFQMIRPQLDNGFSVDVFKEITDWISGI